ncbi:OmpA family protein [Lutibacter sp. B1]|uniref:OmpA family protein n=1 Tax=Lutibacter sp. B1 TaxID=2725996 RepID=UPI001457711C|nr:OmpA family protein [Lutibacter sp. B1]NLP58797.1 OmpA family protein [Lutibacter sp. B1]
MKKILTTLFILTISTQLMVAQNIKRANHLFEKRAYLDAAELFLNEENKTQDVYQKLGDCYYFNTKMSDAAQWYKILLTKYENDVTPTYYYRYSQALKGIKNFSEADKWFKKYNSKAQLLSDNDIETLSFFETLNSQIKISYTIHKVPINSPGSDFGVSYYGDKIVFSSARNDGKKYDWNNQPYLDLYEAEIINKDSANVTPFSSKINTKMHESNAVFTKDGKTMYFTRNNYIDGKKGKDSNKITHLKIYKAQLVDDNWTNITELPFNSNNYSVEHPALSPDEKQLYFASDMPGSIGSFDLFVVDINTDGTYGTPKNLGSKINTELREQFPFISSNNTLYFASNGHFGMGGLDIFKSEITNGTVATPVNLSDKINSNLDDFAFVIDDKTETGYFSSNRAEGVGDDDIYSFTQEKSYFLNGIVQDKNTLELLPDSKISLLDKNNKTISSIIVGNDAAYSFEIEKNKKYKLSGSRKLYVPSEIEFTTDLNGDINKTLNLQLELYKDVEKEIVEENGKTQIKANPIYFDFNKWNIRNDAELELDNVVAIMKKYPKMIIEIGAHTDCFGSDDYNLKLSEKRAQSVREYLVSKGISNNNVKSVGYGETQPVNNCVKPGMCKQEEYDLNRRCEFVLVN